MKFPKIFIDMDGVIVDFDAYRDALGISGDIVKAMPDAYYNMEPIPGAINAVGLLSKMGYDVYLATKPPTGVAHAYQDKVRWVLKHMPFLDRKIIITHNKGLLGDEHDYLIDDRPHAAFCDDFKGTFIYFRGVDHWNVIVDYFIGLQQVKGFSDGRI